MANPDESPPATRRDTQAQPGKDKGLGQRWPPTKGLWNSKVPGLGLGFKVKDKE